MEEGKHGSGPRSGPVADAENDILSSVLGRIIVHHRKNVSGNVRVGSHRLGNLLDIWKAGMTATQQSDMRISISLGATEVAWMNRSKYIVFSLERSPSPLVSTFFAVWDGSELARLTLMAQTQSEWSGSDAMKPVILPFWRQG